MEKINFSQTLETWRSIMRYEGAVYRPPSEANSLIIQLTIGCARNTCTFCYMYKDKSFRIRNLDKVIEDLYLAKQYYASYGANFIRRIFLADGDALIVKTEDLLFILQKIHELFPSIERITAYGAPKDILGKSSEELLLLQKAGLQMIYMGVESGDDAILSHTKKGVSASEMIEAGLKLKRAGLMSSVTLINGLGGTERLKENAVESAKVISAIKPDYLGLLTLTLEPNTPLYEEWQKGLFQPLNKEQIVEEMLLFLQEVDSDGTIFRANHASNYISLAGELNQDKNKLIEKLKLASERKQYKPEYYRGF